MKKTKTYEAPRLLRVTPISLEQGICNSSIFTGGNSVNTTGQQVSNMDYDTDFNPVWK